METHAHADHVTGASQLAAHAGARTAAPEGCGITTAAVQLRDGDTLHFGGEQIRALHTPGHTVGSMRCLWRSHVLTGDTLLINGCGSTDFQSGSAEALYRSITQVLFALPDATIVWPGHDFQGRTHTTIGAEKTGNARVADKTLAEFVAIMDALNLPRPKRTDKAVLANLLSGIRHDAGGDPLLEARTVTGYAGDVSPQLAYKWWRIRRSRADRRADRRRVRMGEFHSRCHPPGVEEVAGHGDEQCIPRRAEDIGAQGQERAVSRF